MIEIEFIVNLGIEVPKWDHPKYFFYLIDCDNYVFSGNKIFLYEYNYGKCICRITINGKIIKETQPIIIDLSPKNK